MCTAASYRTDSFYFGRNLDLGGWHGEKVVITPRGYCFDFRHEGRSESHEAIIGMGIIMNGYPLYFDGMNESGLAIAGLNFPGNAWYGKPVEGKRNVAVFELIPWLLSNARSVEETRILLADLNLTDDFFAPGVAPATLHWMIADKKESIVLEATKTGLHVYDDPAEVLTNNPEFPLQMFNLNNYRHLSASDTPPAFSDKLGMDTYCKGLGALGMPGDLSSMSRFVKASFTCLNSVKAEGEKASVSQFFHILGSVWQQKGSVIYGDGEYEITVYSSCMNCSKGYYYYKTYGNSRITKVDMHKENLDSEELISYELQMEEDFLEAN
ncbi:MAG: choloylglycine hydrolase [Candidatus Ornithospirochaeta sp.]|nr:choloylglycine hydrolase [Candidatus Ornithospirochaeta sp.]